MLYRIAVPSLGISDSRKRSDAAMLAAERAAYDAIAAQAGLDTLWGHAAMRKVRDLDPSRGGQVTLGSYTLFLTCDRSGARS